MAGRGWVKIHRELLDKPIFHNEKMLKVFLWCILKATHEDYKQLVGRQLVDLIAGQFVTGRFKAGEELKLKPSTAWEYLKVLESNNTIDIKSNSKFSVITVVNWGSYQSGVVNSDTNSDTLPDNKSTASQHKQEQEHNKKKEGYTLSFEAFYKIYPNSKGKAQTFTNYKKVIKEHDPETILEAAKKYKKSLSENTDKEFITTSYNFLGNKQVYLDFITSTDDVKPKLERGPVKILTSEDQAELFKQMDIDRQNKIEARKRRVRGEQG